MTELAQKEADLELSPEFQDFFSRIADRVNSGAILSDLPAWIQRNTFLKGRPWSFKDHEYQIAIAKDTAPRKAVKKCSQVGLTELQIRLALAYLRVSNGRSLIYVLPYTKMAMKITQSRIDPIIDSSPALKRSIGIGADSSTFKRIGNSNLYIGGADKPTEAISSPIDRLIIDERDFCRERVLGIYNSRMRHTEEGEGMRDEFSTPTISNFGITAAYERSDQKRYMCKCLHCGMTQAPNFLKQIVIPEFDKDFKELEKEDFIYHRYEFSKSYIRCVKCGKELDTSLATAAQRQWVAKYPGRDVSGYAVKPFDLYKYNRTPRVLMQFPDYPMLQDYFNFVLGEELDTNDNKINDAYVKTLFTGEFAYQGENCCVGIDVGKFVHIFVGKRMGGKTHVIAVYKLRFADGDMLGQVCEILDRYRFSLCVIDAGPDISLPQSLVDKYGSQVLPCVYTKGNKSQLSFWEIKDDRDDFSIVNAARTKAFDHMVKQVNNGKFQFMGVEESLKTEICEHFQQMARKEDYNEEGEKVAKWVKLSDMDHFFHALFYTHLALEIENNDLSAAESVMPLSVMGARIGAGRIEVTTDVSRALRMYGFRAGI
jgi:hypothetical protein